MANAHMSIASKMCKTHAPTDDGRGVGVGFVDEGFAEGGLGLEECEPHLPSLAALLGSDGGFLAGGFSEAETDAEVAVEAAREACDAAVLEAAEVGRTEGGLAEEELLIDEVEADAWLSARAAAIGDECSRFDAALAGRDDDVEGLEDDDEDEEDEEEDGCPRGDDFDVGRLGIVGAAPAFHALAIAPTAKPSWKRLPPPE